ncbi:MAG: Gfo/Idh/MocA family oxidoreductase [Planctomycetota bacterium]|nr:Gfo/Idh/MocA family oxidoreductase [Planctomycetota bacterium]
MAKNEKVKIAIVGCGASVQYMQGPYLRFAENAEFAAAVDPDWQRLEVARGCGARELFTSLDEMLQKSNAQAVIIASPVYLHAEQTIKVAEAGRHVLCEKPMARTTDECDQMIETCKKNGVVLMVAYVKRFHRCMKKAKELIDTGQLGDIFEIRCSFDATSFGFPAAVGTRNKKESWGGNFQDHGSHTIDLCRWWAGEVTSISSEIMVVNPVRNNDDVACAIAKHESGATSIHMLNVMLSRQNVEEYEIFGTKAGLKISYTAQDYSAKTADPFVMTLYERGNVARTITPFTEWNILDEIKNHNPFLKEVEHFCNCILKGEEPLVTGHDGRKAIEVINAGYLSSWKGLKVQLPLSRAVDLASAMEDLKKRHQFEGYEGNV